MPDITFILNGAMDQSTFSGGDRHTVGLIRHCMDSNDTVRVIGPEGAKKIHEKELPGAEWLLTESGNLPQRFTSGQIPLVLLKYSLRTIKARSISAKPCDILYSGSILPHEVLIASAWKKKNMCDVYVCRCDQIFHLEPFRQSPEYMLHRTASRIGMRLAMHTADLVISMNSLIASQWNQAKKPGAISPTVETLPYGLDSDLAAFKTGKTKDYDVAFFARIDRVKGADMIPGILRNMVQRKPDTSMMVIGDGTLTDSIRLEITRLGLDKNVLWKGAVNSDERFELLSRCRVLIYPTREDAFPKGVGEAMMLGLPVVASDNAHLHSVYSDNLVYINTNQPSDYAARIIEMINNTEVYDQYSIRSRTFAESLPPSGNYSKFRDRMLGVLATGRITRADSI